MIQIIDSTTGWNRQGKPAIVHIKGDGFVNFSVEAVRLLEFTAGDRLSFMFDDTDRTRVLFYRDEKGIPLRITKKCQTGNRLSILCRPLSIKILSFLKCKGATSFRMVKEEVNVEKKDCWELSITSLHIPVK